MIKRKIFKGLDNSVDFLTLYIHKFLNRYNDLYYSKFFRLKSKNTGKGITIKGSIEVYYYNGLSVGNNVVIEGGVYLEGLGGIVVGNNSKIGSNSSITTSVPIDFNADRFRKEPKFLTDSVLIGENVWIGKNCVIRPGSIVPSNSIVPDGTMVNGVYETKNLPIREEELLAQIDSSSFVFTFSTGRSGSNAVSSFLGNHSKIDAYHEPFYNQLRVLSANYLSGKLSKNEVKVFLIILYTYTNFLRNKEVYFESDQKLSPFIEILYELFPNAKFIWLMREPDKFLKSAKARKWYADNDYCEFTEESVIVKPYLTSDGCRIGNLDILEKFRIEKIWNEFNQDDKILWYWDFWNKLIASQMELIPSNQTLLIKLESLNESAKEIFEFLGVENEGINPKVTNAVRPKDKSNYTKVEPASTSQYNLNQLMIFYQKLH